MALSISSLASSLSSLSFSSLVSQKPNTLSISRYKSISISQVPKTLPLCVVVSSSSSALSTAELETSDLNKYVKVRLPGGFATQTIVGTSHRKCAIARVVLQEGTGKFIINYRDTKEYLQGNPLWLQYIKVPLMTLGYDSSYDVFVKAHGVVSLVKLRQSPLALLKVSEDHISPLRKEGF